MEVILKMAELMILIDSDRQKTGISQEKLAREAGLPLATYSRHKAGIQGLSLSSLRAYANYAKARNKVDILVALGAYALGLEDGEISINPSKN